jgi:membrane protein DedA with SNARE-associated domain/membrane-associated phospholipid phosphatase
MEALLAQAIDWVKDNPSWSLIWVFVISISESLAIVGLFVPGVLMMGTMGALIAAGAIGFWPVVIAAVLGAIVGDGLSFWLGHYYKNDIRRFWPFNRYPETLNFGVRFFEKYGSLSIVFGRFVGPVRPVIPVVAGMMGMTPTRFTVANVVSALLWAPAYILPGILVGASMQLAAESAVRLAIVLLGLFGAIWVVGWLVWRGFRLMSPRASSWVQTLLHWSEIHPKAGEVARALADPSHPDARALTALAGVLTLGVALFGLASGLTVLGAGALGINRTALDLAQSLSSPLADQLMLALSRLADIPVILALVVAIFLYQRLRHGGRQSNYWLAASTFALVAPFLLQVLLRVPRPELGAHLAAALGDVSPWAFPSSHVLRATVIYGFLAVVLARSVPPTWRVAPYITAAVLVTAVAMARLYLGVEWFTGVLATVALGLVWVAALGLAFRRHSAADPTLIGLWPVAAATFVVALTVHTWLRPALDPEAYRPTPAPIDVTAQSWRDDLWRTLPQRRGDIWQRAIQPLNLQYAGDPQALAAALAPQGWAPAKRLDLMNALELFSPERPLAEFPVPPQVHAGHHETLALTRTRDDGGRLVLRLWATPYRIGPGTDPLWIGNVTSQRKDVVLDLLAIPATVPQFTAPREALKRDLNAALGVAVESRDQVLLVTPEGEPPSP